MCHLKTALSDSKMFTCLLQNVDVMRIQNINLFIDENFKR